MPIITPKDAYYLLIQNYSINNIKKLMAYTLPFARNNIYLNHKTLEIYEEFVTFFNENYKNLPESMTKAIEKKDFISNDNYYQYLLDIIKDENIDEVKPLFIHNTFDALEVLISNSHYSVYLSSLSYAIICLRDSIKKDEYDTYFDFFLSAFLLAASGNILILCTSEYFVSTNFFSVYSTILFSEFHLFIEANENYSFDLDYIKDKYYYIYISALNSSVKKNTEINNPYVQAFHISEKFIDIFYEYEVYKKMDKIFPQYDKIKLNKIALSIYNCQLFDSNDIKTCWKPNQVVPFQRTFIQASDFIENFGQRIKCFSKLSDQEPSYYIDFNEMHYLKIDYHVKDPLYLLGIDNETIKLIKRIYDNIEDPTKMINRYKIKKSQTEKYVEEKQTYAFHKIFKHFGKKKAYTTQIYAVNEAINYLSNYIENNDDNDDDTKHKGCIYQVKTGEGKSIIISALAEIFARMGKSVHVVTSNIVLACRDYEKSYDYFVECKFKSSILLHESEFNEIQCMFKDIYYPSSEKSDFYHKSSFENPSKMNIKVCEKGKFSKASNIIFSTFFNFEGWYLRECEEHPVQMENYFDDCCLIIDESDTILIDELTNGTIISREMKSKAITILEYVYDLHQEHASSQEILGKIKEKWPECDDLSLNDVVLMQKDIKHALEFQNGTKYIIENDKNSKIERIIPFDGEHKGITEREKEFSGFIHQFIGIKEKRKDPTRKIEIRPLSLNYLFISHPIFVNLYKVVWGFTGTIGTEKDKEILKKYYKLDTVEIPQHSTDFRKDLPSILCTDINDRNNKILDEIKFYHSKGIPILVIFENINEINEMQTLINNNISKVNINVFNGTDLDKSSIENRSGLKGMITLGTNFCGRGTNINYSNDYPLHVIISYGPRNTRALGQAIGRTGRNGQAGTTRIICTKKAYYNITKIPKENMIKKILTEYDLKKKRQSSYISKFKEDRPWIFDSSKISSYNNLFTDYEKDQLRKSIININRNTAFNYEYPLCMSIDTFIKIQLQKIYSLINCPECKYTWMLFQRYLRELILESWSLFIDKVTKEYDLIIESNPEKENDYEYYQNFFDEKYLTFVAKVSNYLPDKFDKTMNQTFMRIHSFLIDDWEKSIMNYFPENICDYRKTADSDSYISFKAGFFPFELKDKSGARICHGDEDSGDINFIEDPELLYGRKWSITYVIDKIFEKICQVLEKKLSKFLGLHFYVRRTLAGCEFGICIDPLFENIFIKESHCLFDVKPILLFAVCCKSLKPILAGILIIVLVFITFVAVKIGEYLANPGVSIKDLLKVCGQKLFDAAKSTFKDIIVSTIADISPIHLFLEKIQEWLKKQILNELGSETDSIAIIMKTVLALLDSECGGKIGDFANDAFISKIKINPKGKKLFGVLSPIADLVKIGFLLILLIAAFIKKFKAKRSLKKSAGSYQKELNKKEIESYDNSCDEIEVDRFSCYYDTKYDVSAKMHFDEQTKLEDDLKKSDEIPGTKKKSKRRFHLFRKNPYNDSDDNDYEISI